MSPLFLPMEGPRVFGLSPGVDFSRSLLAGLETRLAGAPPESIARVEIWVNTQRMRRTLLAILSQGPARLLPRIRVLTELAADPLVPLELGTGTSALRRKLELSRLVAGLIAAEPGLAAENAAFDLADSLAELMDEMRGEGISADAFHTIDPSDHAEHWQRSLRFLDILRDYITAGGAYDGQGRMRAAVNAWAEAWTRHPPGHPVIVAGSTGSRGATRLFMRAVARLPQGALVLPGLDSDLPRSVWERLGIGDAGAADHPQFGFRGLADALGFDPATVPQWIEHRAPSTTRNALVSLALRPAPVTDQWRTEGRDMREDLASACAGVDWVEAPDPRAEARAIALALREAAEIGENAALVTPDRALARRVTAELDRWGLIPDDSAGRPLALTPPGVLLRRVADMIGAELSAEALLAVLKHPLTNSARGVRRDHLDLTAKLELKVLRGGAPHVRWPEVSACAEGLKAPDWADWLSRTLAPLRDGTRAPLTHWVATHLAAAEALAAGPAGTAAHGLWQKDAGQRALALMSELAAEADAYGDMLPADYRALLRSLMAGSDVPEEAVVTHPGIAIWGTLEARVQSADLVILGGLNEGIWPRLPGPDPWLSRAMRREIGLPSPERRIGLSAHDFQQAMGAPRVLLTRATRDAEAPTVAARWLLRLDNLLLGLGDEGQTALRDSKTRGAGLLARAALLDRPAAAAPPARRPAPKPPLEAFPADLSVTQIETLVRDPYAIYARKILRLRPLDPPGRQPDALARGSALHGVLEEFLAATEDGLEAAPEAFRAAGRKVLEADAPWPAVRAIWSARLARIAEWFLDGEAERRRRAAPFAREIRGRRAVSGLAKPFAVTAKADRIDRSAHGSYLIYDYKSGNVPSDKEARAFHLQLPLEAAIASDGGFESLAPGQTDRLELIGLGAEKTLAMDSDPESVTRTWERLRDLIGFYQSGDTGFIARLRPQRLIYASDYDHLSRRGEWSDGDNPEEQA